MSRHGLSLGGERRQWLFDFLTTPPASTAPHGGAAAAASTAAAAGAGAAEAATVGVDGFPAASGYSSPPPAGAASPSLATHNGAAAAAEVSNEAAMATVDLASVGDSHGQGTGVAGPGQPHHQQLEKGPVATAIPAGPSKKALEAGGDALLAEVRAAAPSGYFALRGVGGGVGEGERAEDALDWVFEKKEADRVARGTNTDLVLLEVVMVMLKEQVSAILCTTTQSSCVTGVRCSSWSFVYISSFLSQASSVRRKFPFK